MNICNFRTQYRMDLAQTANKGYWPTHLDVHRHEFRGHSTGLDDQLFVGQDSVKN